MKYNLIVLFIILTISSNFTLKSQEITDIPIYEACFSSICAVYGKFVELDDTYINLKIENVIKSEIKTINTGDILTLRMIKYPARAKTFNPEYPINTAVLVFIYDIRFSTEKGLYFWGMPPYTKEKIISHIKEIQANKILSDKNWADKFSEGLKDFIKFHDIKTSYKGENQIIKNPNINNFTRIKNSKNIYLNNLIRFLTHQKIYIDY